ncbi:MAG: 50S ribosomal protein L21e [Candidatus Aenigmarchaeota archaeon]|nr:50S ribosomal protein L21e [Candidatus Aenigmarchaeota archaeon]
MVVKSHGKHRRTREKLRKVTRTTVNQYFKDFKIGQNVAIRIESASTVSMPHRRFQGLTGEVIGKRGRAYIIKIKDCNKTKTVITPSEHLKAV